ncbi:MAG: hypothetical protein NTY53_18640 [Kiritimatiellaeota bacterium]|nr:hypothetical protein [Kiritimatiellota bacterium]
MQFASGSGGVTIFGGAGTNLVFTNNSAGVLPQIVQNSASNITLNIGLTLATNTSFAGTGTGTLTVGGVISGASQLILNGPYTVALTNNNTYTGGTVINTGAVAAVYSTNSLGGGVITINGGTLRPTSGIAWAYTTPITNAVTLGTGNITNLFDVGAQSFQLNGIISGGALSVTGTTGRLILNNTGNTYTNTIISANSTSTPATASSVGCPPPPKPTSPLSTPARSKTAPALRSSTATAPC